MENIQNAINEYFKLWNFFIKSYLFFIDKYNKALNESGD